jgi:hypothetical protein
MPSSPSHGRHLQPTEVNEIYHAWRESEAYAVPMTEHGEELANHRWHGFKKGYEFAEAKYSNAVCNNADCDRAHSPPLAPIIYQD